MQKETRMQRVRIVTAEERLSAANNKTSLAIFGLPGVARRAAKRYRRTRRSASTWKPA
jgi:hypothetical protein